MTNFFNLLAKESQNYHKYFIGLLIALFLNILTWLLVILRIPLSNQGIPLHYQVYFGIDWYGPWYNILIYPASGLLFFIINSLIAYWLRIKEPFFSFLLIWLSVFIQLLILLFLFFLIINFFS